MNSAYHQVVLRALLLAGETGELCRPIHVFGALAEGDGPVAVALRSGEGGPVLPRPVNPLPARGGSASYLVGQTQQAARLLAKHRGVAVAPEHLFLAAIDQGDPEAVAALSRAGLDVATLRTTALAVLAEPSDLPLIEMPPLIPAGTMDRPPLPVSALDSRAWAVLAWRQDRLPLQRVRRNSHFEALRHLESDASWKVATRFGLDDDQRHSLRQHHLDRVEQLAARARPDLVQPRSARPAVPVGTAIPLRSRRPWWCRQRWLRFTAGWGCWFSNRRVGLRDRWFWLRTLPDYRGAPAHQNPALGQ